MQPRSSLVGFLAATVGYTLFFYSCDETLYIRIHVEMMFKTRVIGFPVNHENNRTQDMITTPLRTTQHSFRHSTWKSLSSLWTIAASTEVLYWLAKDIIQVLLESAGRKLGTRLVLCFKRNTVVTHVNKDTIPDLAETFPKTGEVLKNRTHLYTNRSKYIENTFTRV